VELVQVEPAGSPDAAAGAPRIVLVRPRNAGNVGSAARAMACMGLRDLRVVSPQYRSVREAEAMAAHGLPVLQAARVHGTLAEALEGCRAVVATTARPRRWKSWDLLGPREAAELLAARTAAGEPSAIVFGPEDNGLSMQDIEAASHLCAIPTDAEHSSLNLSQAVLLLSWEWAQLGGRLRRRASGRAGRHSRGDGRAELLQVDGAVEQWMEILKDVGYFRGRNRDQVRIALRQLLVRGELSQRDVTFLRGVLRQVGWWIGRAGGPAEPPP
jgi:TrmH family RNA methyltransferase